MFEDIKFKRLSIYLILVKSVSISLRCFKHIFLITFFYSLFILAGVAIFLLTSSIFIDNSSPYSFDNGYMLFLTLIFGVFIIFPLATFYIGSLSLIPFKVINKVQLEECKHEEYEEESVVKVSIGSILKCVVDKFWKLVGIAFIHLSAISIVILFLFLCTSLLGDNFITYIVMFVVMVVAVILISIPLTFAYNIILTTELSIFESLSYSLKLIKGNFFFILFFSIVTYIITILILLPITYVTDLVDFIVIDIIEYIVEVVVYSWTVIAYSLQFINIRLVHENNQSDDNDQNKDYEI